MPRRRLHVDGIVQGVGFRPFVFNLAESLGLTGWVSNTSEGVFTEVEGSADALDLFCERLRTAAPPLSEILSVTVADLPEAGDGAFVIRRSEDTPGTGTLVPPDVATCPDCLAEIRDPDDRRFGYPFTNCTNCGPRWTIIDRIPYDRPFTSMAAFTMCDACRAEYEDPRDRRFHAQPNACPDCGPRVRLEGDDADGDAPWAAEAARLLADGRVLAIKGLGGFHLAVRADDEIAVRRLRERKGREAKPLALMASDIEAVGRLATPTPDETAQLTSPRAPIVLLERLDEAPVADAVAPGHRRLGVMLPYTPLHHLLCDALAPHDVPALVMTSGNAGDEPICLDDDEATARLADIADAWLLHDRAVLRRADDSVLQMIDGAPLFFRRSRGWAPVPATVRGSAAQGPAVLAAGADLKNAVCLLKGGRAFLSPHVGDVANLATHDFFVETVGTLCDLLETEPAALACDLHPNYLTSRWARAEAKRRDLPLIEVQHHHAHMVAAMAEHGLEEPVVGLILDGTGYGPDGTIWGGEILVGDAGGYERRGRLQPVPLPGGDEATRHPWRIALAFLRNAYGDDLPPLPMLEGKPVGPVLEILAKGLNSPPASSCGRLFDAAAALTGRWDTAAYEAQAAIEWMATTTLDEVHRARPVDFGPVERDGLLEIPPAPLIRAVVEGVLAGEEPSATATLFHRTLAAVLAETTAMAAEAAGLERVVLAGGSIQNEILAAVLRDDLEERGLTVLRPERLSPNDGALGLGQAVVARRSLVT